MLRPGWIQRQAARVAEQYDEMPSWLRARKTSKTEGDTMGEDTLTVYGASDDLIEVEGYIREEFNPPYVDGGDDRWLMAFSDGTLLGVVYDAAGVWRIAPVVAGPAFGGIVQAPEGDDDNYSDRATFTAGVAWVVLGSAYARASQATVG